MKIYKLEEVKNGKVVKTITVNQEQYNMLMSYPSIAKKYPNTPELITKEVIEDVVVDEKPKRRGRPKK